jgi:alpha/beta superfamily hydrolase
MAIADADHFFTDREDAMVKAVKDFPDSLK